MILSVLKNSNCRVVLLILLIKIKKGKKSYQVIFLITSFLIHLTRFVCLGDRFIKFSLIRDGKKMILNYCMGEDLSLIAF